MPSQRSALRILTNVALDGALAAVAAVVARWIADPGGGLLHPLWFLGGGAITLLVGGLPFRLSQQYWRFSGIEDLVGVAGGSVVSAALFALVWIVTGYPLPTPTFPIVHALTLVAFLGAPRVFYRLSEARPRGGRAGRAVRAAGRRGRGGGQLPARPGRRARTRPAGDRAAGARPQPDRAAHAGPADPGRRVRTAPGAGSAGAARPAARRAGGDGAAAGRRPAWAICWRRRSARASRCARRRARPSCGRRAAIELKPVALEDLLNRPQVRLDRDGMARLVRGRRVLVTGAGGTIGSELARQVAALARRS